MWRWPLITVILLQSMNHLILPSFSYGAPSSLGPVSQEEAQILWQDGQKSFINSRYQDAVNQLGRYVDRYPGAPGFLEAHFLLGKSYYELNRTTEALRALRYYIDSKEITPASAEARIWLSKSYLKLGKFQEALQVNLELDQSHPQKGSETTLWMLFLRSQALMGLGHEARASNTIEVAEHQISKTTGAQLKSQIYAFKLKVKIKSCANLKTNDPLDEAQALSLVERRGTCLLEALLDFNKLLKTEDPTTAAEATTQLSEAFDAYRNTCARPPRPKPLHNHTRTSIELKKYRAELADLLLKNYKENTLRSVDLLKSWKSGMQSPLAQSLSQLSHQLEKSISKTQGSHDL